MIGYGENLGSGFLLILNAWNEKHWLKRRICHTGWFYMTGTGVKQDKRMGLKWIHKATAQGFEYAKKWCKDNGYSIY